MRVVSCKFILILLLASAPGVFAQSLDWETERLRARVLDPAAFIEQCDSVRLWKLVTDQSDFMDELPEDSGKGLTERLLVGLFESARFQGLHGIATAAVGALYCCQGMAPYGFLVTLVADGPDTTVTTSCTPVPAEHFGTERFADITGDGLPELVLNWQGGNRGWGLVLYSLTTEGVLRPLGRIDSASGQTVNSFLWSRIVETKDSKLPVIEAYDPHQDIRPWHYDSTVRYTNTYYRFRNGVFERAREVSCLPGGLDTIQVVFDTTQER